MNIITHMLIVTLLMLLSYNLIDCMVQVIKIKTPECVISVMVYADLSITTLPKTYVRLRTIKKVVRNTSHKNGKYFVS